MRSIVVAVDGTPASLDALSWARGLAAVEGAATLEIVSVLDVTPGAAPPGPDMLDALWDERRGLLEEWASTPMTMPGRLASAPAAERLHLLEGEPGLTLAEASAHLGADLVVVGAEGTRGRMGPRLDRIANHLAHHLDVPLLVVPCGQPWREVDEVVVAVDGSRGARSAVATFARWRSAAGARVAAVYCNPSPTTAAGRGRPSPKGWYRQAVRELAGWTMPLGRTVADLRFDPRHEEHPALTILCAAEESEADLVVVGAEATNRVSGTRVGGVGFQVLHHARRPTLLVPVGRTGSTGPEGRAGLADRHPVRAEPVLASAGASTAG
jgi:nucleotide-binding universal stress UspA family protein